MIFGVRKIAGPFLIAIGGVAIGGVCTGGGPFGCELLWLLTLGAARCCIGFGC